MLASRIAFVPIERIKVQPLTPAQRAKLEAHKQHLRDLSPPPDKCDLLKFQTGVKNQNPRGSCSTFAYFGAVEAFYNRKYGLNLDLSEEYAIHRVWSVQSTKKTELKHENIPSDGAWMDGYLGFIDGAIINDVEQPGIPEERYAPYFGDGNANLKSYGIYHSKDAFLQKEVDIGLIDPATDGHGRIDSGKYEPHKNANGDIDITQGSVDSLDYDPWRISFDARKNAIYGSTAIQFDNSVENPVTQDFLESNIANNHEVIIGIALSFKTTDASGNDTEHPYLSDSGKTELLSGTSINILDYKKDGSGDVSPGGHCVLLVGYDRPNQRFIFKNS